MNPYSDLQEISAAQVRRRMFSLLLDARGVAESIDAWSRGGRERDALADASAAAWEVVARLEAYGESLND